MDRDARPRAQLLDRAATGDRLDVGRVAPPADLAWCIDYCWWAAWDTSTPVVQEVIPRPVVHVAAEQWQERPRLVVTGVPTRPFQRKLDGRSRTVALAFRPGGFRPFVGRPAKELLDLTVPLGDLVAADDASIAALLVDLRLPVEEAAAQLFAWVGTIAPPVDPLVEELTMLVETAEQDPAIRRAEQLAELAGVSLRTLQRRFREHVGPGPKWVVQRCRLLDVAAAANAGEPVDWAVLAAELGYSDQSHLIQHFRAVVGEPPASYAARQGTPAP